MYIHAAASDVAGRKQKLWPVIEAMATEVGSAGFERGCRAAMTRMDSRAILEALPLVRLGGAIWTSIPSVQAVVRPCSSHARINM